MTEINYPFPVEIEVTVHAKYEKESGDRWNEPRIPAHVEINDIELPKDLKDFILKKYNYEMADEGWGYLDLEEL